MRAISCVVTANALSIVEFHCLGRTPVNEAINAC
eukprot:COSAG02_NODE_11380_length_1735_cov_12.444988_3_plen_33_part_01